MSDNLDCIVVGAGIGGLSCAIALAARGMQVAVLEKNRLPGGKLQPVSLGSFQFDFGPSTMTMPWVYERLFRMAGKPLDPQLEWVKLDVNSRNFFADGTVLDATADTERMKEQLASFPKEEREGFAAYLKEVARLYEIAENHFFPLTFSRLSDYASLPLASAFARVHPLTTMDRFHRRYFRDPRLLAMMNRYATYVGSSPYACPATLSMIAYLEFVRGVTYIRGGNYSLIRSLERLAKDLGVRLLYDCDVASIEVKDGSAAGVRLADRTLLRSKVVVSNLDYYTTQQRLLSGLRGTAPRLSSSGFLMLLGVTGRYDHLHHHNVFYPADYGSEFIDMFERKRWPPSPAIYVCNSSYTEPERAPGGANLYVLTNVPAMDSVRYAPDDLQRYRASIINLLQSRCGLDGLDIRVEVEQIYGPDHIASATGAYHGALYGAASNSFRATFFRPTAADRSVQGLYYAGGSVHPGGGTPMTAISGLNAAELIARRAGLAP